MVILVAYLLEAGRPRNIKSAHAIEAPVDAAGIEVNAHDPGNFTSFPIYLFAR